MDMAMQIFEDCMSEGWVLDGVMSQSIHQAQELENCVSISLKLSRYLPRTKNDISVLISRVPEFIADIDAIVSQNYPDFFKVCWFGHIGDGNLHLNILKPENLCQKMNFWKMPSGQ